MPADGILQLDKKNSEGIEAHAGKLKNQFQNNIMIELCPGLNQYITEVNMVVILNSNIE